MSDNCFRLKSRESSGWNLIAQMSMSGDRFITELIVATPDETFVVLHSVEGTAEDVWPSSGPLQEVVPQSNDSGDFLAGVGAAGKSHWSTIVTSDAHDVALEFDFACRIKSEADWLGSTYKVFGNVVSAEAKSDRIEFPTGRRKLVCRPLDETKIELSDDQQVRLSAQFDSAQLPQTARWKYRFELE